MAHIQDHFPSREIPSPEYLEELLQEFWDAGISNVTPGSLGMMCCSGWCKPPKHMHSPFEQQDLDAVVARTPGVKWDFSLGYATMIKTL